MIKKITDYQSSQLQFIYYKLAYLKKLQAKVAKLLPENIRPFCAVANQEGPRLTLAVATSAWAARLRYVLPDLKKKLAPENITIIDFYVEPNFLELFKQE